jgi:hypothetical protein
MDLLERLQSRAAALARARDNVSAFDAADFQQYCRAVGVMPDRRALLAAAAAAPPRTGRRRVAFSSCRDRFPISSTGSPVPCWRARHKVHRINLHLGDQPLSGSCRRPISAGPARRLRAFLAEFLDRHRITDLIWLGDRRPYHLIAAEEARRAAASR